VPGEAQDFETRLRNLKRSASWRQATPCDIAGLSHHVAVRAGILFTVPHRMDQAGTLKLLMSEDTWPYCPPLFPWAVAFPFLRIVGHAPQSRTRESI